MLAFQNGVVELPTLEHRVVISVANLEDHS